jgi:hypothetical protein
MERKTQLGKELPGEHDASAHDTAAPAVASLSVALTSVATRATSADYAFGGTHFIRRFRVSARPVRVLRSINLEMHLRKLREL